MPPAVSFAEGAVVHVVVVVLLERKRTRGSWRRKREETREAIKWGRKMAGLEEVLARRVLALA